MAHPNEELLKKGYEAFSKGDMDTLRELFATDILWHAAGDAEGISGDFKGIDQVLAFFGKLVEKSEGSFKVEIHDILVNDEHGVVLSTGSVNTSKDSFEGPGVEVFHIKDGKITEAWTLSYDQARFDKILS